MYSNLIHGFAALLSQCLGLIWGKMASMWLLLLLRDVDNAIFVCFVPQDLIGCPYVGLKQSLVSNWSYCLWSRCLEKATDGWWGCRTLSCLCHGRVSYCRVNFLKRWKDGRKEWEIRMKRAVKRTLGRLWMQVYYAVEGQSVIQLFCAQPNQMLCHTHYAM